MGEVLARLVVILAALNWALIEFADFGLLVDGAGLGTDTLTLAYAAIAVAAGVSAYNLAIWQGWLE